MFVWTSCAIQLTEDGKLLIRNMGDFSKNARIKIKARKPQWVRHMLPTATLIFLLRTKSVKVLSPCALKHYTIERTFNVVIFGCIKCSDEWNDKVILQVFRISFNRSFRLWRYSSFLDLASLRDASAFCPYLHPRIPLWCVPPNDVLPSCFWLSHWSCIKKFPINDLFWYPFILHSYNMTQPS